MKNRDQSRNKRCSTEHQQKVSKAHFSEDYYQEPMLPGKGNTGKCDASIHATELAR
jgi:hypothetical protein